MRRARGISGRNRSERFHLATYAAFFDITRRALTGCVDPMKKDPRLEIYGRLFGITRRAVTVVVSDWRARRYRRLGHYPSLDR